MALQTPHRRRRHHRHRLRIKSSHLSFAIKTALIFLLISSFCAQFCNGAVGERRAEESELINRVLLTRRRLIGPGSSPPICRFKCGRCSPCKPVHVPIQPGLSYPLEYYPEAWRCTCGNKLYMP